MNKTLRFATISIAACAYLASVSGPLNAQTSGTGSVRAGEPVTLNFSGAEIEAVARTMATITGRNVVVDPRVKGLMNLQSERAISPAAAFDQFLAALRLQGFTVVETAGLYKVVPEADAKLQAGAVSTSSSDTASSGGAHGNRIVTQIFRLNYESANNLVPVLRPLISPNNTINVNPGNNSLVITDYADNLQRLARIIAALDVPNATDIEVIPLKHTIATDIAPLVARLIEPGNAGPAVGQGQSDNSFKTTLLAEPRSNALVLRAANPARVALVRSLVAKLDQPAALGGNGTAGNIYVVYLKNADAAKLAVTLRAALAANASAGGATAGATSMASGNSSSSTSGRSTQGLSGSASSSGGLGAGATDTLSSNSAQPSTGGQIQADPATNSLIITAPEPQYRQLRAVIDQLDGRRAQVLVESLIAEVNVDKAAQFGIQWQTLLGQGQNVVGLLGNNFSVGGTNIFDLAASIAAGKESGDYSGVRPPPGMNLGLGYKRNGSYVLGALANLLQSSGDGNVLSNPNLLTLDNEEARILIGENVLFVTGSYATTGSSSTVNPFTTVERKDVGLMLRVKPQINENGTVKMVIYQETSQVKEDTAKASNGPTTRKRTLESTVLVDDGSIIVLGGLLEDKFTGNQEKIPYLGDMPVVGALFRSDTRVRSKTNLMVFLRPVVIRSSADSQAVSMDRYDLIRGAQQHNQPSPNLMVPINQAPVLPAAHAQPQALGQSALKPPPLGLSNPADEKKPTAAPPSPAAPAGNGAVWR